MSTATTPAPAAAPATLEEAARVYVHFIQAKWDAEAAATESERPSRLPRVAPGEEMTPLERMLRARVFLAEALVQEGGNNGNVLLLIDLAQDEVNAVAEALADPSPTEPQGEPS